MKQIILPFNTGQPELIEVPAPGVQSGEVLIRTVASVVSTGTERMLLNFGQAGWLGKLRQQPEKARQVLDKLKTDGLLPTVKAVQNKLDTPIPLGYSSAGIVLAVGAGIHDIRVGDRVACNGAHAEIVSVPRNLLAKIPDGVSDESAAFTVLGAIALQSIRLAKPTFGETVVVFGLGLIGQLTAQLLVANGCRVIGADLHPSRLKMAAEKGVEILGDASGEAVQALTDGHGADAVIITASGSNDSMLATAADMCRKRGRIVLTGVVDMKLSRDQFFKKELSFQVSSSYGPGRYEPGYEQKGLDYPIGYVRWTEGRNFEAVLSAMQRGQLDVTALISERLPFENATTAYTRLDDPGHLAILFTYSPTPSAATQVLGKASSGILAKGTGIAVIGAGHFVSAMLLPALQSAGATVQHIVSKNGLSASNLAGKYNIPKAGTDYQNVLSDETTGGVVIATPHNTHAQLTQDALHAGRHVFVEKPLALTTEDVHDIARAAESSSASLTVGFNRRFAPLALAARDLLHRLGGPCNIVITVNAGPLPKTHWLNDPETGGGRIIGEACHFIDLAQFFAQSPVTAVCANACSHAAEQSAEDASILLRFANGSNAAVNYFSNGSKAYDKERVELYRAGTTVIIENWRSLKSFGFKKDIARRLAQDKGHKALVSAWVKSVQQGGTPPVATADIINSSLAAIAAADSLRTNSWISL
jgi:predicted dehydrogenase/threonine dehydrogenase-like Zn-dependent dehydrogenase